MTADQEITYLSWAPSRSAFIRQALIQGCFTFALLSILGSIVYFWFDLPIFLEVSTIWVLPIAFMFTLGFIFDDTLRWRSARYDRWQITNGHLIHEGQDGSARIPLTEIENAFRRLGSNVVVQLISGQRIVLRYLPFPAETAAQINAARPT